MIKQVRRSLSRMVWNSPSFNCYITQLSTFQTYQLWIVWCMTYSEARWLNVLGILTILDSVLFSLVHVRNFDPCSFSS